MKYLYLLLAGIIFGTESRSLNPSNFEESFQWSPTTEKLLTKFAETSIDEISDGDENSEIQWLNRLKSMLNDISREANNPKTTTTESSKIFPSPNGLTELIDSADELDFYYPEGRNDERHVKSRYEDFSALFPVIREDLHDSESTTTNRKTNNDEKELDSMLLDFQSQINRMQKYLGKLCRNRKSTKTPEADSISSNSSEPKKISILH